MSAMRRVPEDQSTHTPSSVSRGTGVRLGQAPHDASWPQPAPGINDNDAADVVSAPSASQRDRSGPTYEARDRLDPVTSTFEEALRGVVPRNVLGDAERGDREVIQRLRGVLEVATGERRLLPGFGCRVHEMQRVESKHDRAVAAVLIEEALERWVPELFCRRVMVTPVSDGRLRVSLSCVAGRMVFSLPLLTSVGGDSEEQPLGRRRSYRPVSPSDGGRDGED